MWNAEYGCGYELMMLLPPGVDAQPIARMRMTIPAEDVARYDGPGMLVHAPDGRDVCRALLEHIAARIFQRPRGHLESLA